MAGIWTASLLAALCASGVAWLCLWLHEHGIRPNRSLRRFACGASIIGLCVLSLWAGALIQQGGSKPGGDGGTGTTGVPPVASTDEERPGERAGRPFSQCGDAPVTNADWLAFGAHTDWFHIPEGNWCFRFGTNLLERVTVLSCGDVYANLRDASNRISVLGLPFSIVPAANWHMIGNGEQGTGNYQLPTINWNLSFGMP